MNWIKCNEQLPGHNKDQCKHDWVLVYSDLRGPGRVGIAQYENEQWVFMEDANSGAHSCTGIYDFYSEDVTHWQPLPEAPIAHNEE